MGQKTLLREWIALEAKPELVLESKAKNEGKIILSGVIQRADTKNQNKRIYPSEILKRECENYMKAIREGRAVGELDHPESSTVSLTKASHVIREMWWDGNDVHGRIEVLGTKHGQDLAAILEAGVTVGISSRGVGSTEKTNEGFDMVQPDFQLICFDIVSEPSTPGAYLFAEGKQVGEPVFTKADRIFRALNAIRTR